MILSNYSPEECFTRVAVNQPHKIAPLLDRLTVIDAKGPIRLTSLIEASTSATEVIVDDLAQAEVEVIPDSPPTTGNPLELLPSPIDILTDDISDCLQRDYAQRMEEFERDNDPFIIS